MADATPRTYEALLLLSQNAGADLAGAIEYVRGTLTRHQAEILILRKWDERKLAYPIRGQKRGIFLLSYFKAPTNQLHAIERDFTLSENIARALIIKADHVGEVELDIARREENLTLVEAKLRDTKPAEGEGVPATMVEEVPDLEEGK